VLPFDDSDDTDAASATANDTRYGLAADAWTQNLSEAHRLAAPLRAGVSRTSPSAAGAAGPASRETPKR